MQQHQQHPHHSHHSHQVLMDPGHHLGHARHLGPPHYGAPGPVVAPLYPSMTTPTQSHTPHGAPKRPRPDELDLSVPGIDLEQTDLETMQQTPLGTAYAQATQQVQAPTHHHHRLPDTGPPSKMMRRDGDGGDRGGAPSVVGQAGMPTPAPRPRGPKLKFTPEDDQLLIDLKENKSLTWKQIADFFPGRSSGTLQVRYCTKLKAKTTQWTDETDQKLRTALQDYENEKWRIVANKVGTGFTPAACRERTQDFSDEEELAFSDDLHHATWNDTTHPEHSDRPPRTPSSHFDSASCWVRKAQRTQGPKNCASSSSNHRGHKYFFAMFTSASTSYLRLSSGIVLLFCWIPHPPNSRDTPEHHGSPFFTSSFSRPTPLSRLMTQRTHYRLWGATQRTTQSTAFLLVFIPLDAPLDDFGFFFSTIVINFFLAPSKDLPLPILSKFGCTRQFSCSIWLSTTPTRLQNRLSKTWLY
ncbi:MYB DNA-binding domain-containing protein [Colletotrichum abscissum]|uniref:MYB DNA-binding domain-containing protein n=1 Tax=Colletotrichum abscissum TaxID=1671311 RepID=A0A9P9XSJ9_9PEZI|nr:MYB DNA-binding domain-containing protein [Colletotrichum abscissum]